MDYVILKQTDLKVSRIVLGTMTFGGQADESASGAILDLALASGVNFIDTANAYNKGVTEEILGRYLRGKRDQVVLASKVFNRMGDGPDEKGLSRAAINRGIEDSLRRLQTDYLDIYYLHAPDWTVPIEESLDAMQRLVDAGKIRYVASSNYAAWQVAQMQQLAAQNGWKPAVITQPMYNLLARGLEQEYLAMADAYQISMIVYNPLAGGLLTGKHRRDQITPGTRFDNNRMYQERYWHEDMFDSVEALQKIAQQENRMMLSLAINWLYRHTPVDCIIMGATSAAQLQQSLDSLKSGALSENALRACDVIWHALRGPAPKYNR